MVKTLSLYSLKSLSVSTITSSLARESFRQQSQAEAVSFRLRTRSGCRDASTFSEVRNPAIASTSFHKPYLHISSEPTTQALCWKSVPRIPFTGLPIHPHSLPVFLGCPGVRFSSSVTTTEPSPFSIVAFPPPSPSLHATQTQTHRTIQHGSD